MRFKHFILMITVCFTLQAIGCSMFKITQNGKTFVGNNEDYFDPTTKIWFTPGQEGQFGVVNFGFDNKFPQGAMNEAGLVFDGFAMDYLPVRDTAGKKIIPNTEYLPYIMHTFGNVREVKAYFETINLSHLSTSMYLFVDATGEYLVVEGDSLILGNEEVFSLSNFYPSQVPNSADVRIPFYQNGKGYIDSAAVDLSFSSCSNVMNNFHQDFTQYTCVYDLDERVVNLYHFHDYDSHVTFRLAEELAKGDHEYFIPELFSKDSEGYQYYYDFNYDAEAMTQRINDKWLAAQNKFDQPTLDRIAVEVESMVNTIGYKWLRKGELDGAITLFVFNTELFPLASNTFDSLGEAYMHTEEYDLSIANYKKAIKLNKTNKAAKKASKKMLKKVKKLKRSSN